MNSLSVSTLIKDLPALSSLPAVIEDLEKAIDSGEASMEDLGEIVKKDTDLTARLLKLANSSFYGFPKGVETVAEALSLIGLEQMKQLLTGSSVIEYFDHIPASSVNMKTFWEHSIATGIAAKVLSIQRRSAESELFFVCGLIHDIGRLVLYLQAHDHSREVIEAHEANPEVPLTQIELDQLGFDHAMIGGELLKKWDFPHSLVNAVTHHHQPARADVYYTEAALINMADFIVHSLGIGNSGERLIPRFDEGAWNRLDMPTSTLRMTIRETEKQYTDIAALFVQR